MTENSPATIKDVAAFFKTGDPARDTLSGFAAEWKSMPEADREQIKAGIGDGSLNY